MHLSEKGLSLSCEPVVVLERMPVMGKPVGMKQRTHHPWDNKTCLPSGCLHWGCPLLCS